MSRADKLYSDPPKMERDSESGKMGVSKAKKAVAKQSAQLDGTAMSEGAPARRDMVQRHVQERMQMHGRHEADHESGKADTAKHESDLAEMHSRHLKEMKGMHKSMGKSDKGGKEKPAPKEPQGEEKKD